MERNAHRLTLHSPASAILHWLRMAFIDIAKVNGVFMFIFLLKK
jgi:hypothetical protein